MVGKTVNKNRVSGASFLSDDEFVVIRLGQGQQPSIDSAKSFQPKQNVKIEQSESEDSSTQIRRITMKKEGKQPKKMDSVASVVIDRKESLKTPLIVQTISVDSYSDSCDEDLTSHGGRRSSHARVTRQNSANFLEPLNKTDLPRSLRSTRRLSACNEQILMEHFPRRQSTQSRRSSSITEKGSDVILVKKNSLINDSEVKMVTAGGEASTSSQPCKVGKPQKATKVSLLNLCFTYSDGDD